MKQVLVLTDVDFWNQGAGHRRRIYSLLSYLTTQANVTVAYIGTLAKEPIIPFDNFTFKALGKRKDLTMEGYGRNLRKFVKDKQFDVVLVEYIHNTYYLNYLIDDALLILDLHDIISERTQEFEKFNYGGSLFEISKEAELSLFEIYDYLIVLCEPDLDFITSQIESSKVLLCPHPGEAHDVKIKDKVEVIGFLASEYIPNVDAIQGFLDCCWPEISSKHDVTLNIYGNVTSKVQASHLTNVNLIGYVQNIDDAYNAIDIVINPVRFGAGLKIKNIEALAYGKPLVTTQHGARGIDIGVKQSFLIADSMDDFTLKLQSLIEDFNLRQALSINAQNLIKEAFSPDKCFAGLDHIINQ